MTTEFGRVKCWISTERLRQKEVVGKETGMVYNVKATTTTPAGRPKAKAAGENVRKGVRGG